MRTKKDYKLTKNTTEMFKKILLALALIVPMLASAQTVKIGYCNPDEVLQAMPEFKKVQTQLAEISKKYEDQLATMRNEYNAKVEEFQKLGENEPQSIKERKQKDIEDMQARMQQFYETAQTEIQRQQQTLAQPLHSKLQDAVDAVGKEGGFTVILYKDFMMYYASPAVDVTPLVKKKLGIQ